MYEDSGACERERASAGTKSVWIDDLWIISQTGTSVFEVGDPTYSQIQTEPEFYNLAGHEY